MCDAEVVSNKLDARSALEAENNQNRIDFLRIELTACYTFANVAETEHKAGDRETAERSRAAAEKGFATLQRSLTDPKHAKHISQQERDEFTAEFERLRKTLDSLSVSK